jgi:CHAT domain-containing protein/tetratricopeptide (TPR) repeat protein
VLRSLLLLGLAAATAGPSAPGDEQRLILRQARLAVEGDSAAVVGARWAAQLSRDSTDRAAILGLATLARFTNDDATAERLFQRLLARSPARADAYAIYARFGLARLRYEAVQMEEVDSLVSAALDGARVLHDSIAEGDALQALGNARVDERKWVGLAYHDSALRVIPERETDLIAAVRCRRALIMFFMGDARTQRELASALEYSRRVRALRGESQCLRAAGRDLWGRGLEDSAIVMLRRATDILRRVRDRRNLAFTLTTLADVMRDRGAYREAKDALRESIAQSRASGYPQGEALATHMLGTLYYSLRDLPTSARLFDQAFALYGTQNDTLDQMNVRSWQANIARDRGDLATARRLTLETINLDKRTGSIVGTIELYHSLADIEILAGDWPAAAAALDSSEHLLRTNGIDTWRPKLVFQRGRLALYRGDLDAAERIFRGYLRTLGADEQLQQHETRAYLADILARRGDLGGAERELAAAGDALDAWRSTLDDQELRLLAFQATATDESDRNASVARVVAALGAGGRVDAAFGLAERRRARELGQRLLEASVLEASPAASTALAAPMAAAELAALLPDDSTALIEYVTGAMGAPTTAFVVTRRGGPARARVLLAADSLTGRISRFLGLVARGQDARVEASGLGAAVLEPVLAGLDPAVTRLVIVPDGPLHRVPWDALRLGDGRYMVERYAVSIAPSAGTVGMLWRRSRGRTPAAAPARLLAFGDPDFGGAGPGDHGLSDPGLINGGSADSLRAATQPFATSEDLPRLPGSGAEARLVARYAPESEVRLRRQASADYLRHAPLGGFEVIHFATHALVDDRALGRTALALAPDSSGSGFVTPGELASLRLDAGLVVLSACRTAGGVVVDGEGMQGLTAALLEAGARSVVATSWRVGDRGTVRFVERFYGELARGKPVVEALRAAKLVSLREGDAPGTWAAFSVVGDPTVVVRLREPPRRVWWAWSGGLAVVLIAAAVATRRRRLAGTSS